MYIGMFGRYIRLLQAAKDVDKFTKFVVEKYDELRRQLELSCDVRSSGDDDIPQQSKTTDRLGAIYTVYTCCAFNSHGSLLQLLSPVLSFAFLCTYTKYTTTHIVICRIECNREHAPVSFTSFYWLFVLQRQPLYTCINQVFIY